jgi:hypothetical protein
MNKPIKPYVLRKEEAERDIFNAVNDSAKTIPWCSVEDILTNILHQVRAQAEKERAIARQNYDKELAEFDKAEEEAEKETANEVEVAE